MSVHYTLVAWLWTQVVLYYMHMQIGMVIFTHKMILDGGVLGAFTGATWFTRRSNLPNAGRCSFVGGVVGLWFLNSYQISFLADHLLHFSRSNIPTYFYILVYGLNPSLLWSLLLLGWGYMLHKQTQGMTEPKLLGTTGL